MVGWYRCETNVSKPNMETIYSHKGEVVLYKRLIAGTGSIYALYKGNKLIANINDLRLAVQEYNACITSIR